MDHQLLLSSSLLIDDSTIALFIVLNKHEKKTGKMGFELCVWAMQIRDRQ